MADNETHAKLQELLDRQAIEDVLVRYCRGLDRGDKDLILSAFHPDGVHNHVGSVQSASDMVSGLDRPERTALKAVVHHLTNVTIDLRGDLAGCESYFVASHLVEHGDELVTWIVAGRYVDQFERRRGEWRITDRTAVYDWSRVDRVAEAPADFMLHRSLENGVWGSATREDFSYRLLPGAGASRSE